MTRPLVAVILASNGSTASLDDSLSAFTRELDGMGELVVVNGKSGALVPLLWSEGLQNVDAEFVVFSTTQMTPHSGWLRELIRTIQATNAVGVGGVIKPGRGLSRLDRAIYLQRFLDYQTGALPLRPSGENAIYRLDALRNVKHAWASGFWEIEVQQQLELQGASWASSTGAIVCYQGSTSYWTILQQRLAHGRWYGRARATVWTLGQRVARLLAMPCVPMLLLIRTLRSMFATQTTSSSWIAAIPGFFLIVLAWTSGEAIGILSKPRSWIK